MIQKLYAHDNDPRVMQRIIDLLNDGGIIIYPTDSVYAIGCHALKSNAVERICEIKGVDHHKRHIKKKIVNKDKIINKTEVEISSNIIEIEEFITKYIVNYIEEVKKKESVELIGIATPGNAKNGIIYEIVNLGIKEFNITKELQQYYNVPILVRNDAK